MDFTLRKYGRIVDAAKNTGYELMSLRSWFANNNHHHKIFLIRHDVDRHPERALAMAALEAEKGITASYYFRIVPCSFKPEIIRKIASLGHEVGYHYEDWYLAGYNPQKAIDLYRRNLAMLRKIAPVETIVMHGSPLSRQSNLSIWEHFDLTSEGVKDAIRSADFSQFAFFTDTGRTFGPSRANLRDFVGSQINFDNVKTPDDLILFLNRQGHDRVYFSAHCERWTDQPLGWSTQYVKDQAVNVIKIGLRLVRQA